jgi:hypothetical protein
MARLPLNRLRRPPWRIVLTVAVQVAREGRRRWERLSRREQAELKRIVRKSRGLPTNVTASERDELRRLVWKALGPGR